MLPSERLAKLNPAVGKAHKTMMKQLQNQSSLPCSLSLFLPVCFFLHLHFLLNTPLKLKASLVSCIEGQMQVETQILLSSSQWENESTFAISSLTASSYCEQVQYVAATSQQFHSLQTHWWPHALFHLVAQKIHCYHFQLIFKINEERK